MVQSSSTVLTVFAFPRFDFNIEPVFAVMALYDARERKKISESFHLDCNSSELQHMLDDHMEERSLSSLSRSAIFNITYPNSDVFLIIKVRRGEGGKEGVGTRQMGREVGEREGREGGREGGREAEMGREVGGREGGREGVGAWEGGREGRRQMERGVERRQGVS